MKIRFAGIILLVISVLSHAQITPLPEQKSESKFQFTPFVAPSYSPSTSLMLIGGGLLSFDIIPDDTLIQRSVIPFSVGYSLNRSFMLNIRPSINGIGGRVRINGDIWIKDMPDNYWGTGYENGSYIDRSDTTTKYDRYWWQVRLDLTTRLWRNWYAGLAVDMNETIAENPNPQMINDPDYINFGPANRNTGYGLIMQYDSRDLAVNAYSGMYLGVSGIFFGTAFGGENKFDVFELDYRQYLSLAREGQTLAWQVKSRFASGDVPWSEMSMLGTPFDLRGYRWGRYRDRTILFGILEYRHMFLRAKPDKSGSYLSRHGVVAWIGAGTLAQDYGHLNNWLPNFGGGYRFEVQDRFNARVDFGVGQGTTGFYVSFNEAF